MVIIVIEDNPYDSELIRYNVKRGIPKAVVIEFPSLESVPEIQQGDCALIDLKLRYTNGVETLRVAMAKLSDTPIVIVTGHEDETLARELLETGAQDVIFKDHLDPTTLRRAVIYAMSRHTRDRLIAIRGKA